MKRRIVWLVVSCLMVLSLVMASCAPAAVVEEKEEVVKEEVVKEEVEKEVVAPTVEKPKYGGVLKVGRTSDITDFDEVVGSPINGFMQVTNEGLWAGDWTKGPAGGYGTNETDWTERTEIFSQQTGYIAESYEIPNKIEGELCTLIYHIRKGVHFALNPESEASRLVGGRELTADDVVFTLSQQLTDPRAALYKSNPELRGAKITSPAPWTVKIEIPWEAFEAAVCRFGGFIHIVPPEVVAKYGTMRDWKVSVGTGPFMLTNFVPGSVATYVRNPNYWMKDPIGPGKGNQLPYLDGVKFLIIPDRSTIQAALRTAKIDQFTTLLSTGGFTLDEVIDLKKTAPQLMFKARAMAQCSSTCFKLDRPPFNDIRVRRAMMMAIDFEAIKRDYFLGEAQILVWPIPYVKEYAGAYLGLDDPEMPESVKELYSYNPEKAKALLAEAGYPTGFKTNLICGTTATEIDYYSIFKDMWSKVGIDVDLRPKESGALSTIEWAKNFDGMFEFGAGPVTPTIYKMLVLQGTGRRNVTDLNDPVVNEAFVKVQMALVTSEDEAARLYKELMKYVLPQVWRIPRVYPYTHTVSWPWVKNYSGEGVVGYYGTPPTNWAWIDQELKKAMGY